ncbi:thymidine kinase [Halobacillus karajensis]|uniref:thymidine kinase n=1 Tax=Halobacillus karajensis TaxID=195088 RepID=UPI00054CFA22|nr:hypothetical protein [Halobacillus karajensis]
MEVGTLEIDVGGMFAEKSTSLIRKGKRHILAGRNVVFLKPKKDDRYGDEIVATHDGRVHKALNINYEITDDQEWITDFVIFPEVEQADVVCIDEVQFFPYAFIELVDELIYKGKKVYLAGLDLDRFGNPFGVVPALMAKAEHVEKHHAVCGFCGNDAWVSIGSDDLKNDDQVNVGNDYIPACRSCAYEKGGVK